MSIAVVLSVTGQAWARDAEGNLRELRPGDVLQEGEVVVTSDDGSVDLDFGGGEAGLVVIEPGQEVLMQAELVPGVEVDAEQASVQDDEVEALLAALEDDDIDLLDILEDTAAGAGAGDAAGGGHGFVRLARITEGVDPLSFQYGFGLAGGPEGGLGEPQLLEEENFFPSAGSSEAELFDENLLIEGGSFFEGTLNFDFGLDGIGGINFAAMAGTTATIGTELVVYSWSGNTLTATIEGGDRDGTDLFELTVNPVTGEYTLTLLTNVLHTEPGTEGDESVQTTLTFTVLDSDGDSAQGNLVVTFFDDVPVLEDVALADDVAVLLDETDAGENFAGGPIIATSGGAVLDFTALFGADGPAEDDSIVYGLALSGDGSTELTTTVGGHAITLVAVSDTVIEGQYDGTNVAFTVEINADGSITVTQYVALAHPVAGDDSDGEHSDTLSLAGLITATVEITDGDGDTASGGAEIGAVITFVDDGPTVEEIIVDQDGSATIDESAGDQADELAFGDLPEAIQLLFAGFDGEALADVDFGDADRKSVV